MTTRLRPTPRTALTLAGLVLAAACAGPSADDESQAPAQADSGTYTINTEKSWLDRPFAPWNAGVTAVPAPPAPVEAGVYATGGRCANTYPKPVSATDSAVTKAGWTIINTTQVLGNIAAVIASAEEADGMCRPFAYNVFVFVDGAYAGTVAPGTMASRMDGSWADSLVRTGPDAFTTKFSRYVESDPLCCPSSTTTVHYRIETQAGRPVVVATTSESAPNPDR